MYIPFPRRSSEFSKECACLKNPYSERMNLSFHVYDKQHQGSCFRKKLPRKTKHAFKESCSQLARDSELERDNNFAGASRLFLATQFTNLPPPQSPSKQHNGYIEGSIPCCSPTTSFTLKARLLNRVNRAQNNASRRPPLQPQQRSTCRRLLLRRHPRHSRRPWLRQNTHSHLAYRLAPRPRSATMEHHRRDLYRQSRARNERADREIARERA